MKIFLLSILIITNMVVAEDKSSITVYNNGGVINNTKTFELNEEFNQISFGNISNSIAKNSIIIMGDDVYEISYKENKLTHDKLMRANIGKEVNILSKKDNKWLYRAILLTSEREPLLKRYTQSPVAKREIFWKQTVDEKIEFLHGAVGASGESKIEALVGGSGETEMELLYMDSSLGWVASYVGVIENGLMSLNGMLDIRNGSDLNHRKINLKVVAGKVNMPRVQKRGGYEVVSYNSASFSKVSSSRNVAPVSEGGYFTYNYPRKVDIDSNSTKKLFMFTHNNVELDESYLINAGLGRTMKNIHPSRTIEIDNSRRNLGVVVPNGAIKIFERSNDGGMLFVGSGSIKDKNIGETIKINVGNVYDIISEFETVEKEGYRYLDAVSGISSIQKIMIINNRSEEVTIKVSLSRPHRYISSGAFKYEGHETMPAYRNNKIEFDVTVPGNTKIQGEIEYVRKK
jgi:hypothetical protein